MGLNLKWSNLEQIRKVKIISSMYIWVFIVPVLAKSFEYVNEYAEVTIFEYQFIVNLSLPFSWKMFYFSAVFFGIATMLYQAFCPKLVKDYPTYSVYESEGKPIWHLRDYAEEVGVDFEKYRNGYRVEAQEIHGAEEVGRELAQNLFWNIHWRADESRSKLVYVCFGAYVAGFFHILIVFIQNLFWVIKNIIG